jgi:pimeloyl-ACP methyl ester carboxylesterase
MTTLFLVHGGLWDSMDAEHFWRTPGIVAGLESHGLTVLAPDRPRFPSGWNQEVDELGALLPSEPVTVVGASNGCTVAARLVLTLRGVTDSALAGLEIPVAVLPSVPENPSHQRMTVDALLALIPGCRQLPGCPEPPTPDFPPHLDEFVATLASSVN